MEHTNYVRGYKVFNSDWTCSPNGVRKQYACPGKFEEDVDISVCNRGMHFCKKAVDCFKYYDFNPENKVAEVIAYGDISEEGDRCCTNKLELVREIPWGELLEIVNAGKGNSGSHNSGDQNSGNRNSGNYNSGNRNSGDWNSGNHNSGDQNCGSRNSGNRNSGSYNSGDRNSGNNNSNYGNSGDQNSGNWNSGSCNSGNQNSGNYNSGDWNSGNHNSGDRNSGDWNKCNFSNGCFNTTSPKIYLFNKPSEWTYIDWLNSKARRLLNQIPGYALEYIWFSDMTDEEKVVYPEAETTGGYLKKLDNSDCVANWWGELSDDEKAVIKAIPNFDKVIFKEITGIDVD